MRTFVVALGLLGLACASGTDSSGTDTALADAGASLDATPASADAGSPAPVDASADVVESDAGPRAASDAGGEDAGIRWAAEREDNWALRETRVFEAWALLDSVGRPRGGGVLIVHPDTGISRHPELLATPAGPSPIQWSFARDFVDGDDDADHDFRALNRIPPTHGHGTETASVIVSAVGCPPGASRPCVSGVAPDAWLAPMRVTDSVVLLTGERLAEGIEHAVRAGAHVISISLGGVGEMAQLEAAVARALQAGVIIVAAAGNWTGPIVVKPSSIDGVVCVAGVTPALEPWLTSANGPRVDISAPAVDVLHARTSERGGVREYTVGLASGTSDATAITAGAAALWLAYHGRDELLERYGPEGLPQVFRQLVRTAGVRRLPGWPTDTYGAGMLDVEALLLAPLP